MWGWLKGLGGGKGQKSAHEIYKVCSDRLLLQTSLGGIIASHLPLDKRKRGCFICEVDR